jgi:hypothetical protein
MLNRFTAWTVMVALTAALVTVPAATANAQGQGGGNPNANSLLVPITGTVAGVGTLAGNLAINRFAIVDGVLNAVGVLTATITGPTGEVIRTIMTPLAIPVASATGTCDVLNLVLGPLHLDLLGLVIDLNQVVLNIVAQTGAGNLLGNLLCAITGLLDGGALGQQLVGLLNRLLGVLA